MFGGGSSSASVGSMGGRSDYGLPSSSGSSMHAYHKGGGGGGGGGPSPSSSLSLPDPFLPSRQTSSSSSSTSSYLPTAPLPSPMTPHHLSSAMSSMSVSVSQPQTIRRTSFGESPRVSSYPGGGNTLMGEELEKNNSFYGSYNRQSPVINATPPGVTYYGGDYDDIRGGSISGAPPITVPGPYQQTLPSSYSGPSSLSGTPRQTAFSLSSHQQPLSSSAVMGGGYEPSENLFLFAPNPAPTSFGTFKSNNSTSSDGGGAVEDYSSSSPHSTQSRRSIIVENSGYFSSEPLSYQIIPPSGAQQHQELQGSPPQDQSDHQPRPSSASISENFY
jgi:hypothetical protein